MLRGREILKRKQKKTTKKCLKASCNCHWCNGWKNSPFKVLKGVVFLQKKKIQKLFFGNESINKNIDDNNLKFLILNCKHKKTIRMKIVLILFCVLKNSSIFKALEYAKNNENSGFVSSGSTAAIMVLSRLHMGMIDGIDRPAICSLVPNEKNASLIRFGANVIVNGSNFFNLMGFVIIQL